MSSTRASALRSGRADLRHDGARVVDLGGRRVRLAVRSGTGPPVVLAGGCGIPSYHFDHVAALLPGRWLVGLDRPGLRDTPWPGTLPSLADEVATLVDLAAALGEPLVVVAHSMAGLHAEAFARQAPERVHGLVLLDGSIGRDPTAFRVVRLTLPLIHAAYQLMRVRPVRPLASSLDRVAIAYESRRRRVLERRPLAVTRTMRRPDAVASFLAELAAYDQQVLDLGALRGTHPLPDVPVVVVTAVGEGGPRWLDKQRRLAELLGARQVVVEDSRHLLMHDRPDLVAQAVTSVVDDRRRDPDERVPVGSDAGPTRRSAHE